MKRRYSRKNSSESDCSSLSPHPRLDDNCENELSKKSKSELTDSNTNIEEEQMRQRNEIPESCSVTDVTSTENDYKDIPESHCENGKIIITFVRVQMD